MITNAIPAHITTHDQFVEYFNANISDFARAYLPQRVVEAIGTGDYYDREYVASEVHYIAKFEAMTDDELRAAKAEQYEAHQRRIADEDYSEYDVNDYETYYHEQWLMESLLAERAAVARYTGLAPLTHSPFAGLVAA